MTAKVVRSTSLGRQWRWGWEALWAKKQRSFKVGETVTVDLRGLSLVRRARGACEFPGRSTGPQCVIRNPDHEPYAPDHLRGHGQS